MQNKRLILFVLIVLAGQGITGNVCAQAKKTGGEQCSGHDECISGACDFAKGTPGICAPVSCRQGNLTGDYANYCNGDGVWMPAKEVGSSCLFDYECFRPVFIEEGILPNDSIRLKVACLEEKCTLLDDENDCLKKGYKRIIKKEACLVVGGPDDPPTICSLCGDGVCNEYLENHCNCAEDCKEITEGERYISKRFHNDSQWRKNIHPCQKGLRALSTCFFSNCAISSECNTYVCSACPNGTCESWEDACNCPKDCRK